MKHQFNSGSNQQQVKTELSKLKFETFLKDSNYNKRKAVRELKSHLEKRAQLCPSNWRDESHKMSFLREALVLQSWAENTLSRMNYGANWRELCNELGNALQIRIEQEGVSNPRNKLMSPKTDKPKIHFAAPRYAKNITKAQFPGSERDTPCWNCGEKGHWHLKCTKILRTSLKAARRAEFYQRRGIFATAASEFYMNGARPGRNHGYRRLRRTICNGNTFFGDADDTESEVGDQSSSSDDPNECNLPNEISHAIVPQIEDSDLDF